ncbi:MAG: HAMP domain-containing protein [Bryobacteraceae bacterium]|nr:HAMP domain-containing protein [Bryobacteraceae bacterium]
MRSVFTKVLLWCFGTLVLSLIAFSLITSVVAVRSARRGGVFARINAFHLQQAIEAYQSQGRPGLREFVDKMEKHLPGKRYLTDAAGRDLLTGEDHSALLRQARDEDSGPGIPSDRPRVFVTQSNDGRYRLIIVANPPVEVQSLVPYYLLVMFVVAFLLWLLAVYITSPLRKLAKTVDRFGRGDLAARARLSRRDEIGELANAFDQMADRIQNLLTSERRLLQDISHELRSPLARLSFAAELTKTAPDRDAAVARIKKEVDRLTDLVRALIDVTRAEGDPEAGEAEPLALQEVLREVVDGCQVEAEARNCSLQLTVDSDAAVLGDRELLRRAVENVVRNAIRHAPEGTPVDVTLAPGPAAAVISVRDRGPGVPEEALSKIFTPFFRVDSSRDAATGGIGLGLAIAQRAVSLHHGSISARNAQPGLLVAIEIPLSRTQELRS